MAHLGVLQEGHKFFKLQVHHSNGDYIFWLDSASCPFACPTTTLFDELELFHVLRRLKTLPVLPNFDLWKISGAC